MLNDLVKMNLIPTANMYNAIMAGYFREVTFFVCSIYDFAFAIRCNRNGTLYLFFFKILAILHLILSNGLGRFENETKASALHQYPTPCCIASRWGGAQLPLARQQLHCLP